MPERVIVVLRVLIAILQGVGGAALVVGILLLVINQLLIRWRVKTPNARPLRTALVGTLVVTAASVAGAIQFAVERPWF